MSQIFSETRSKIHLMSEDKKKVFTFDVPSATSLGEAYDVLTQMRASIWEKLEADKKTEDDKKIKEECKAALQKEPEKKEEPATVPTETIIKKKNLNEVILGEDKK